MDITNAALGNSSVKALVYIDAFVPAKGQSAGEIAASEPGSGVIVQDPTTVFNLVPFPGASDGDADLPAPWPGSSPRWPAPADPYTALAIEACGTELPGLAEGKKHRPR